MVQPQGTNNYSPNANQTEAADPTFFEADPLQPGEVHLHHIKTKDNTEAAFHALNLCTHKEQKSDGEKGNNTKQSR